MGFYHSVSSGASVIGELYEDYAENIFFKDLGEERWFAKHLLEYLDHDPSLEATIGGKRVFYTPDGRWQQVATSDDEPN
ncbi:MAG TPA: hypothetical protein VGG89_02000 [Candidatus Baltobacteraceae bacterium]